MKLRLWVGLVVVAGVAAALWWRSRPDDRVFWQGYAEADYVNIGPPLQGRIIQISVARGDHVAKGAALFRQDDIDDRAALAQAKAVQAQAEASLINLQQGAKPAEIAAAEANLADAQAAANKAADNLRRDSALLKAGYATRQIVAQETADAQSAVAHVASIRAALDLARAPNGRDAEIAAQAAQVASLRAATAQAQWRVDQRSMTAPAAGVVADVMARPGETIDAGAGVVSLLPPENIFVRFFVGETQLASIHLGDRVRLICDNCPGGANGLPGHISFIAPQTEYTPPVIYSDSQREKLVTEVEARPDPAQASLFNPGMPVQVEPAK